MVFVSLIEVNKPVTIQELLMLRIFAESYSYDGNPIVEGQTLDFQYNASANKIMDKQTRSEWNFDGIAVNGKLKGKQLVRLSFDEGFWFSWAAFHPQTRIYPG